MKPLHQTSVRRRAGLLRQRGAVLIVALIVLVALGLAALALLRSVDILGLISGNLSLQRSALNATDVGATEAINRLGTWAARTTPSADNCYSEVALEADKLGIPKLLGNTKQFLDAYPTCFLETSTREKLYFVVDRQCSNSLIPVAKTCVVAQRNPAGCDMHCFDTNPIKPAYRVTVRVDGEKNANSYSQTIVY
jgi:type IV pilus assembly protein PilX